MFFFGAWSTRQYFRPTCTREAPAFWLVLDPRECGQAHRFLKTMYFFASQEGEEFLAIPPPSFLGWLLAAASSHFARGSNLPILVPSTKGTEGNSATEALSSATSSTKTIMTLSGREGGEKGRAIK